MFRWWPPPKHILNNFVSIVLDIFLYNNKYGGYTPQHVHCVVTHSQNLLLHSVTEFVNHRALV